MTPARLALGLPAAFSSCSWEKSEDSKPLLSSSEDPEDSESLLPCSENPDDSGRPLCPASEWLAREPVGFALKDWVSSCAIREALERFKLVDVMQHSPEPDDSCSPAEPERDGAEGYDCDA